ncbi:MAG: hypothetical protein LW832_07350 [Parachlamydia sp.]|jgi:hypothetical protein|nr:hypothetical protein [Parachlamydia sp.]
MSWDAKDADEKFKDLSARGIFFRAFIEVYCLLNLKETGFRFVMKNHTTSA